MMPGLLQDLRYACRSLAHAPGFTATVVVTLALGIGTTTAMFSVVDGVLLRPLPYADAERVVTLWQHDRGHGVERDDVSAANFLDWRQRSDSFSHMAAVEPYGLEVAADGPRDVGTWRVTEGYFESLGARPLHGRTLGPADYAAGAPPVVVVGHDLWRELLGGDRAAVGRTLSLDGVPTVVVGVMPPDFGVPAGNQLWVPIRFAPAARSSRAANYFRVVARLRPGVSLAAARAEMDAIGARLAAEHPETNAETGVSVVPLPDHLLGRYRTPLFVLLVAAGGVLLIACVNAANLLLVRGAGRRRELAVRTAVGAGRGRLHRQLFVENLVLALLGGAAGTLLAQWGVVALLSQAPQELPRVGQVGVDPRVLLFAVAASLITALFLGVVPVLRVLRRDPAAVLGEGGRTATAGGGPFQHGMVVAQVTLALILLAGTGLMVRSFVALLQEDPGFDADDVVAVTFQAWHLYPDPGSRSAFVRRAVEELEALPGVGAAGMTSSLPLDEAITADEATFTVDALPPPRPGQEPVAHAAVVTSGFFSALRIPLLDGRLFTSTDDATGPRVAVVNRTMVRRFWGDASPLGETVTVSFAGPPRRLEIVGVVGDVRQQSLDLAPRPALYVPHAQSPTAAITFVARTGLDAVAMLDDVQNRLWEVNARLAVADATTLESLLRRSTRERRFYLLLLATFAVVAVLLAVVGIHGLMSYVVRGRSAEICIRMALGARRGLIVGLHVRRAAILVAAGLGLGLAGALALTRFLTSLLYEVEPTDPLNLAAAALLLGSVAMLAAWLAARRAARLDPVSALRME